MATATQRQPAKATAETTNPQQSKTTLDEVLEATTQRVQSIRNTAATFLGVPPHKVCAMLRNVWRTSKGQDPLTDEEMFMGMSLIARYGLDPIAREVYVTRDKDGRLLTIVGIDGWIKILDRTEHYDGFEQELHFTEDGKTLEWVETKVFSKTRSRPTVYRGFAAEYGRLGGFMANKIAWHMLRLFSLRHAARLFTPIGGSVVTEEEARWMSAYDVPEEPAKSKAVPGPATMDDLLGTRQQPTPAPQEPMDPPFDPPTPAEVAAAEADEQADTSDPPAAQPDQQAMEADALEQEYRDMMRRAYPKELSDLWDRVAEEKRFSEAAKSRLAKICAARKKEMAADSGGGKQTQRRAFGNDAGG